MSFDILCRNSCCDCHNQMPSCLEQGQFSIFEKVKLQILQTGRRAVFLACTVAIFEKENKETLHILRCTFGWQSSCTCTLWFGGAGFDQRVVLKDKAIILEWKYIQVVLGFPAHLLLGLSCSLCHPFVRCIWEVSSNWNSLILCIGSDAHSGRICAYFCGASFNKSEEEVSTYVGNQTNIFCPLSSDVALR